MEGHLFSKQTEDDTFVPGRGNPGDPGSTASVWGQGRWGQARVFPKPRVGALEDAQFTSPWGDRPGDKGVRSYANFEPPGGFGLYPEGHVPRWEGRRQMWLFFGS